MREVKESPLEQGIEEQVTYTLTTTPWGSAPSVIVAKVYSVTSSPAGPTYADVTATVMPTGSPSVNGDVITLPVLKSLTENIKYRLEIKFTTGGSIFEAYAFIQAKR